MKTSHFEKWASSKSITSKNEITKSINFKNGSIKKMSLWEIGHFDIDRFKKMSLRNRSLWKMSHLEIHNFENWFTSKSITSKMGQFENWSVPKWVTSKLEDWPIFEVIDFEVRHFSKCSISNPPILRSNPVFPSDLNLKTTIGSIFSKIKS